MGATPIPNIAPDWIDVSGFRADGKREYILSDPDAIYHTPAPRRPEWPARPHVPEHDWLIEVYGFAIVILLALLPFIAWLALP